MSHKREKQNTISTKINTVNATTSSIKETAYCLNLKMKLVQ